LSLASLSFVSTAAGSTTTASTASTGSPASTVLPASPAAGFPASGGFSGIGPRFGQRGELCACIDVLLDDGEQVRHPQGGTNMHDHLQVFTAIGLWLGLAVAVVQGAVAQQNPVTAIDIALEPDATMVQHAMAANARLRKSFPKGFALDETHHPHISMLQQFVRTDELDKVFAAANAVIAKEKPTAWTLKAFKYYYIPAPPIGLAGIVVEPTEDLHRLQDELIKAVAPYTVNTGTPAAFSSNEGGRDIQKFLISYVANFVTDAAGKRFNPHVTIGVGTEAYLNKMLAEPFASFTFSPAGASVYQLGSFGTARKEFRALTLTP
jgi:2'-5' RNA ligase